MSFSTGTILSTPSVFHDVCSSFQLLSQSNSKLLFHFTRRNWIDPGNKKSVNWNRDTSLFDLLHFATFYDLYSGRGCCIRWRRKEEERRKQEKKSKRLDTTYLTVCSTSVHILNLAEVRLQAIIHPHQHLMSRHVVRRRRRRVHIYHRHPTKHPTTVTNDSSLLHSNTL